MPKIRGVKPDYWTDEDIVDLSIPARLLFVGLWNYACDNGHLQDKPKQIKMRLLPGDDVNVAELLRELAKKTRIQREDGWIIVPNFTKHQRPDKRYFQTCDKPGCTRPDGDSQPETRSAPHEPTKSPPRAPHVGSTGPHVDGDGDGELKVMVKGAPTRKRATQRPSTFKPNDKHQQLAAELGVDLRREWVQFCDHHDAKGSKYVQWNSALNTWIRNAAKFAGNVRPLRPEPDAQGRLILPPLPGNEWSGR